MSIPQQAEYDEMEQEAQFAMDELVGEWLVEFYGDRGVPGSPVDAEVAYA